jgi:hypothetical protein
MTQPDLETIRQIQSATKGTGKIAASQVKDWLRHPSVQVLGAVTQHIVRQSRRVEPPLTMQLFQGFQSRTRYPTSWYHLGIYTQDEWRARPGLTITITVRAEHQSNVACQTHCFARNVRHWLSICQLLQSS